MRRTVAIDLREPARQEGISRLANEVLNAPCFMFRLTHDLGYSKLRRNASSRLLHHVRNGAAVDASCKLGSHSE